MQHDASGNLKAKGQTTYQWDVGDRLIGISGSGVTASFSYDALRRRASKTVNGQTLGYQYDGANIIQDSNSQYLQGLGIDDVLSRTTNGNNEYYLKDHLGSTVALSDQSGNLATQYGYSPYGQVSKTGTSNNYFTYTGREDDSTGLYYYRARYYSPDLKRFVAEDPVGFRGNQSNLYAYVGGNPTGIVDPFGKGWFGGGLGGLLGGLIGGAGGGTAGTLVAPGVGTLGGAGTGAIQGGIEGAAIGSWIEDKLKSLLGSNCPLAANTNRNEPTDPPEGNIDQPPPKNRGNRANKAKTLDQALSNAESMNRAREILKKEGQVERIADDGKTQQNAQNRLNDLTKPDGLSNLEGDK